MYIVVSVSLVRSTWLQMRLAKARVATWRLKFSMKLWTLHTLSRTVRLTCTHLHCSCGKFQGVVNLLVCIIVRCYLLVSVKFQCIELNKHSFYITLLYVYSVHYLVLRVWFCNKPERRCCNVILCLMLLLLLGIVTEYQVPFYDSVRNDVVFNIVVVVVVVRYSDRVPGAILWLCRQWYCV